MMLRENSELQPSAKLKEDVQLEKMGEFIRTAVVATAAVATVVVD